MEIKLVDFLNQDQKAQIVKLWNAEYPAGLAYESMDGFEEYLSKTGNPLHYLVEEDHQLIGWMATFERDKERRFSIILDSKHQNKGLGKSLINEAKIQMQTLNGWVVDHDKAHKLNGEPYFSPLVFYLKNGFKVLDDIRLETEKISAVKIQWTND
jgi:GNAT superfamily N-acetyltransferase